MFNLDKRRALVTGASGAIGGEIAKFLAISGAEVVITGRNEEKLQKLSNEIVKLKSDASVGIITQDLSSFNAGEELLSKVEEKYGDIDTVICNSGITNDKLMFTMKEADLDQVLKTNLYSSFALMKASARKMSRQRFGRIIAVSSVVAFTGNAGQTNYSASKAALIGVCKSLAQEVATRNITVNAIAPGFIVSDMTAKIPEKFQEQILATIPCKRMGEPNDIAAAALFLASTEASYITGQTLHVNGGMYMT